MRRLLVFLAMVWVAADLVGAWLAVDRQLPYDLAFLDRSGRPGSVGEDWLLHWGTGLAAPLAAVAAMALLAVLCTFPGRGGRTGYFLIAVLGGLSITYTLADQHSHDRLVDAGTDRWETAVVIATLGSAALIVLIGLISWLSAPRSHHPHR